jgi:hypothetical protein
MTDGRRYEWDAQSTGAGVVIQSEIFCSERQSARLTRLTILAFNARANLAGAH